MDFKIENDKQYDHYLDRCSKINHKEQFTPEWRESRELQRLLDDYEVEEGKDKNKMFLLITTDMAAQGYLRNPVPVGCFSSRKATNDYMTVHQSQHKYKEDPYRLFGHQPLYSYSTQVSYLNNIIPS